MGAFILILVLILLLISTARAAFSIGSVNFLIFTGFIGAVLCIVVKQIIKSAKTGDYREIYSADLMKKYHAERAQITAKRYRQMLNHNARQAGCLWKDTPEGQDEQLELNILDEKYAVPGTFNHSIIRVC